MLKNTEKGCIFPDEKSICFQKIEYKSVLVANAVLLLIDTASYFLKRQIEKKSAMFLENGGFAERMFKLRNQKRKDLHG